ncbi:MAG TPA: hypothetical protein VKK19_01090 [Candidatus Dormibacteraeota bacterium]|nr:hypothetical protein [Candidatus Dormibacteraeota bacterium]
MSSRQLLGGAAILVVLATVLWYLVTAQSRINGAAPDAMPQVALSATATGTGSWVRYLVTVKNLADGDFDGDVLLIDQPQDRDQQVAAGPAVSAFGGTKQIPTAPTVAGESAYRVHLTVPSRKSVTVAILAPAFFTAVEAVMGNRQLDFVGVTLGATIPVAVLSDVETAADAIEGLHFDRFTPRAARFNSAHGFPTGAMRLAGFAAVVIDQFDTATLSQMQVKGLSDFVGFGGTLLLAGGTGWRRSIAPLPTDLLPIRPTTTVTLPLTPVATLAGASQEARSAPAAAGTLAPGARAVVDGDGGVPLVAELTYGAGKIVELAYDPSGDGTSGTPYASLGWSEALGRGIGQLPGNAPTAVSMLGPDPAFTALLPAAADAPLPPPWLAVMALLLYVMIVGPIGYLLTIRRWKRPALFWMTVPLSAAIFTGAFYLIGTNLQGSLHDSEIQVVRIGPGQAVNVLEYHRVLFLRRGNHQIDPGSNSLVAPMTLETFRVTGSTCDRCLSQLGGLPSGSEHVIPGLHPVVDESGVVYGSVRVVASSQITNAPLGLDAQLGIHGGMVQGTVLNLGPLPVLRLELFTYDGQVMHRSDLVPYLPPGGQEAASAPLVAADSGLRGPTAESILLRAVAADALHAPGQAVLVGLMPPLASQLTVDGSPPPQAGLAVIQQQVTLGKADSSVRDIQRKWLASATGDQKGGFTDVYDIVAPQSSVPLVLSYSSVWANSVELYDWSKGRFVPAASVTGSDMSAGSIPLTADLLRDGMVRVRVHEPRLSWGTNVWVDTAA